MPIELQPSDAVRDFGLGPLVRGWAWLIQPLTRLPFALDLGGRVCFA